MITKGISRFLYCCSLLLSSCARKENALTSKTALKDTLLTFLFGVMLLTGVLLLYGSTTINNVYACDGQSSGCNPPNSCGSGNACQGSEVYCLQRCSDINCSGGTNF